MLAVQGKTLLRSQGNVWKKLQIEEAVACSLVCSPATFFLFSFQSKAEEPKNLDEGEERDKEDQFDAREDQQESEEEEAKYPDHFRNRDDLRQLLAERRSDKVTQSIALTNHIYKNIAQCKNANTENIFILFF